MSRTRCNSASPLALGKVHGQITGASSGRQLVHAAAAAGAASRNMLMRAVAWQCTLAPSPALHQFCLCSDSALVQRLQPEIERFGRALRWVHRLEPLFAFIPINQVHQVCSCWCSMSRIPGGGAGGLKAGSGCQLRRLHAFSPTIRCSCACKRCPCIIAAAGAALVGLQRCLPQRDGLPAHCPFLWHWQPGGCRSWQAAAAEGREPVRLLLRPSCRLHRPQLCTPKMNTSAAAVVAAACRRPT